MREKMTKHDTERLFKIQEIMLIKFNYHRTRSTSEKDSYAASLTTDNGTETFEYHKGCGHRRYNENTGKKHPTGPNLVEVLYCLVSDARAGEMDPEEFSSEFGYESVTECIRVHKACVEQREKLGRLGLLEHLEELEEIFQDY